MFTATNYGRTVTECERAVPISEILARNIWGLLAQPYSPRARITLIVYHVTTPGGTELEQVCCKKLQKSPNQETGLGNRGPLEALNDTK